MAKFYDTNALLELGDKVFEEPFYISSKSLEEIESIKVSSNKDSDVKYKARHIARSLLDNQDKFTTIVVDTTIHNILNVYGLPETPDNLIIACAVKARDDNKDLVFVSYDVNCAIIAEKIFKFNVESDVYNNDILYKGYKTVYPTDEELSTIYTKDNAENIFEANVNEYVVIKDSDDTVCDIVKWTGERYSNINVKPFKSRALGNLKPLDEYQRMAFDTIVSNDMSVLFGRAGSGKTTIPLSFIMQSLESGKYRKCYIVHSFDTLKGQKTLGYVKGDQIEKLTQSGSIGGVLASKLGDMTEVERLLASGQIEIVPTANLRGVEYSADSICFCTEAQNLDLYALKTLIQRCKGKIILEGDILEQCDTSRGIGLFRVLDVFKGYKGFGCVKLKNNYRSEISELADRL